MSCHSVEMSAFSAGTSEMVLQRSKPESSVHRHSGETSLSDYLSVFIQVVS